MVRRRFYTLLLVLLLSACAQPVTPTPAVHFPGKPTLTPTGRPAPSPATPTQSQPDAPGDAGPGMASLGMAQNGQTIPLKVGQVVFVANPDPSMDWQIDTVQSLVAPYTPPAGQMQPGAGWYFRALAAGQTDLTLTGKAACANPPCPPNVQQFTWSLDIRP